MENTTNETKVEANVCPHCKKEISAGATKCPHCQSDLRSWPRRHPVLTGILGLFGFSMVMGAIGNATHPTVSGGNGLDTTGQNTSLVSGSDTPQDQLKAIVANVLHGTTNMSHENRLKRVDVVEQTLATPPGGWGVFVEFNADDNLTTNMTKGGIEMQMSDIYIALYTSGIDVRTASVAAYLSLTNQYGNSSDQMVYKSILDKGVASKVNWGADKSTLELQILPGLWDTTILSPALRS